MMLVNTEGREQGKKRKKVFEAGCDLEKEKVK